MFQVICLQILSEGKKLTNDIMFLHAFLNIRQEAETTFESNQNGATLPKL